MMVYIFAFFGFMIGFSIGLGTLNVLLRHRSNDEIKKDPSLRWYGAVAWVFGLIGGVVGILIYNHNFL